MHDTHCHLDLYKSPLVVANSTEESAVFTFAVTNLPSAYFVAKPHMKDYRFLKLAVGLHPLLADHHNDREWQLFMRAFHETDFVGEVGLDFSSAGISSKETQIATFRLILEQLKENKKAVTVHSRQAESTVLELLDEYRVGPVIFHWYSGGVTSLDKAVSWGHYVSANPAMVGSKSGQRIIDRVPKDRLLCETDGPFVQVRRRPAMPTDVSLVHEYLASRWKLPAEVVSERLDRNLLVFLDHLGIQSPMSFSPSSL